MNYSKRINLLCSLLIPSKTFADVGCDHGYCSQYVLENGLCDRVIISDVSKGSLDKAKQLLASYIEEGKVTAVLGDGFFGVPKDTEQVLIAGMGGYEIIKILSHKKYGFMPKNFLFQPMHDGAALRRYIIENGGVIEKDFTFVDGRKYYDVIVGSKGVEGEKQAYSEAQILFGKDNLLSRTEPFLRLLKKEVEKVEGYLQNPALGEESKQELLQRKELLIRVIDDEIK